MEKYFKQLIDDIHQATQNITWPFPISNLEFWDWIPDKEEKQTAPRIPLEEWTGIKKEQLPPENMLTDQQIETLLKALINMLNEYNWMVVFQITIPKRIQYKAIRDNFDQEALQKRWHMGFFKLCKEGTKHGQCALGNEYCQCKFFEEFWSRFEEEDLTPEEERARELDIEVSHIKRKYGDDFMKYYPYHLDPEYDDEDGNPYNYGFDDFDEDEEDNWWRK